MVKAKNSTKGNQLFQGINVLFTKNGKPTDWNTFKQKLVDLGATILDRYVKKLNYIVATEEDKKENLKGLKQALSWESTYIVSMDFITKCIDENKIIDHNNCLINFEEDTKVDKRPLEDDDADKEEKVSKMNKVEVISDKIALKAVDENVTVNNVKVYQQDGVLYDVMLNQTNLDVNNNKFYILQLLVDNKQNYYVWSRWGRVGVLGQSSLDKFNKDFNTCLEKFESKFNAKSGNKWLNLPYQHKKNKYFVMERDYEDDDEDPNDVSNISKGSNDLSNSKIEVKPLPESKLLPRVYDLIKKIFDVKMMNDSMSAFDYDTKKMPLGKLTKDHIKKSMTVLNDISNELSNPVPALNNFKILEQLSSTFYTIIPHAYGMRRPPIINTKEILKAKLEMVEALAEIQIANSLMKKVDQIAEDDGIHPLDKKYTALNNNIVPLDKEGNEFNMIKQYVKDTHGDTHNWYDLEVLDAFELVRTGESQRFQPFETLPNRKLLWHGSRMTNFVGILSQGLRIAPPEAPVTGYMFGKGVYFADIVSKSANYCCYNASKNEGLMLLCEVALGEEMKLKDSDYDASDKVVKSSKFHCTKGVGRYYPDPKSDITLENNTVVPKGKPIENTEAGIYLQYNEYIVYNTDQIKMKYLIRLKFNNK